jgi:hypothetical protein
MSCTSEGQTDSNSLRVVGLNSDAMIAAAEGTRVLVDCQLEGQREREMFEGW